MTPSRNTVLDALLNLLKQKCGGRFKIYSRKLKLWTNVDRKLRPALYITDHIDSVDRPGRALPGKTTLDVKLFLYAYADPLNEKEVGSVIINDLIDAVELALAPDPVFGLQTLGGLVSSCWIEGDSLKEPGDIDGDALALIPVKILVP